VPFKIHAHAVVLVLFLSVMVGGVGVSAMPHGPARNSATCEALGAAPANVPDVGTECASSNGGVLDLFSQVVDDIRAIHTTVEAKAQFVANQWTDLNDFINRMAQATPTN
jgi:hypothetical protein